MSRRLAFVLLAACSPTTFAFSPTMTAMTSKPETCPVEVLTSLPSQDYQEVGTLEFYNGTPPKTIDAFKDAVAKQVCHVGGDAVVAIADDKGQFTKGTIIEYTSHSVAPARRSSPPEQQHDKELPK